MRCPICHYDNSSYSKTCADCGEHLTPSAIPQKSALNTKILDERFEKIKPLSAGGMGKVFLGRVLATGQPCIIKEIPLSNDFHDEDEAESRKNFFITEARMLSQLDCPGIPRIFAYYTSEEKGCLVIEYIDGKDLEQIIKKYGIFNPLEVIQIALKITEILDYLHTQRPPIIFGDLKPSNIVMNNNEEIYLVDFGIARFFQGEDSEYLPFGSPGYAAPEQYKGIVDVRVDIYSFGATLHYLLTGFIPINFKLSESLLELGMQGKLTRELVAIITRMLDIDPEKRPQSAGELKRLFSGLTDKTVPLVNATQALTTMTVQLSENQINTFIKPQEIEKNIPPAGDNLKLPLEVKWKFSLDNNDISAPVVKHGITYLLDETKTLFALDNTSGSILWQVEQDKKKVYSYFGPLITCEGKVIFHLEKDKLCAVDCRIGTIQWETRLKERKATDFSYANGEVFFSGTSKNIYRVNVRLGELHSLVQLSQLPTSKLCLDSNGFYVGTSGNNLYCLNQPDGGIRWQRKFSWLGGKQISATPIADTIIYVCAGNRQIYGLNKKNGETVWEYRTSGDLLTDPIVAGDLLITGDSSGRIYALSKTTGTLVWRYQAKASIVSSPLLAGEIFVCADVQGNLYFLHYLTGELLDYLAIGSPVRGKISFEKDRLFFTTENSELVCLGSRI